MNSVSLNDSLNPFPYCSKLKEVLRRNKMAYHEHAEDGLIVLEIKAREGKDPGYRPDTPLPNPAPPPQPFL